MAFELAKKATEILKENTKIRPYYTRNWLLLGGYTNILIEGGEENLKDEAISYFEKAKEISPKRQEIPLGLSKTYLLTEEYQKAKESAQECINLNARLGDCWWQMALSNIYLGEEEMAKEDMEIAKEKGYQIDSEISLLELAKAYLKREKYQELIKIYQKLIAIKPENPKYYIALAVFYKETGQIEEAKKEALKILELFPEYKEEVEEFLKTLSK
jgi:tetratricopeptide (TPR) repeat protein